MNKRSINIFIIVTIIVILIIGSYLFEISSHSSMQVLEKQEVKIKGDLYTIKVIKKEIISDDTIIYFYQHMDNYGYVKQEMYASVLTKKIGWKVIKRSGYISEYGEKSPFAYFSYFNNKGSRNTLVWGTIHNPSINSVSVGQEKIDIIELEDEDFRLFFHLIETEVEPRVVFYDEYGNIIDPMFGY